MACLNAPSVSPPTLPPGISIGTSTPPFSGDVALCCKSVPFDIPPFPLPLGIPLNPAINAAIVTAIAAAQTYLDQLQIPCPLE